MPVIKEKKLISNLAFVANIPLSKRFTIKNIITLISETKMLCSAFAKYIQCFISQTFDKIWHDGLLFKIQYLSQKLHAQKFSYLERYVFIKLYDAITEIHKIRLGILQGSVLDSFL